MNFTHKITNIKYGYSLSLYDNKENFVGELRYRFINDVSEYLEDVVSEEFLLENFPDNSSIYITYIAIEDNFKGIGAANYLMNLFIQLFIKQKKFNTILLDSCPIQYGSTKKILNEELLIKFYQKFGFVITPHIENKKLVNTIMLLKK